MSETHEFVAATVTRDPSDPHDPAILAKALPLTLGMQIVELTRDRVVMTMPVDERTRQPFGLLHGGASAALAETAVSIGGWMNVDPARFQTVGVEINANHLRAKRDGIVRAVAVPLHRGRTLHVWSVEITDEEGKLVCVSRCTLAVVPV